MECCGLKNAKISSRIIHLILKSKIAGTLQKLDFVEDTPNEHPEQASFLLHGIRRYGSSQ